MELSEREQAVLDRIPSGGGEARQIRVEGLSPQARSRVLKELECKGLVERYPNGHGPEEPWWWTRLPLAPEGFTPTVTISKGKVFDRYEPNYRPVVHAELKGDVNEYGCARATLKAGDNNSRETWIPLHLLEAAGFWSERRRGAVTEWSAQFHCDIHGECSYDMVTTAKTCALCGRGLTRY